MALCAWGISPQAPPRSLPDPMLKTRLMFLVTALALCRPPFAAGQTPAPAPQTPPQAPAPAAPAPGPAAPGRAGTTKDRLRTSDPGAGAPPARRFQAGRLSRRPLFREAG